MKLTGVELRRIRMPLVAPFRTSFGTETCREVLLLRMVTADAEGWGECVAMEEPLYSSEYVDAAQAVMRDHLLPRVFAVGDVRCGSMKRVASAVGEGSACVQLVHRALNG